MWLGHVLRNESLLHDIIEGRMRGKATKGRKRMHLLSDLMKVCGTQKNSRRQERAAEIVKS